MEEEKTITTEESHSNNLKTLRTYQGDVEEIIGKTKASIATIAIAEQEKRPKPLIEPETTQSPLRNKMFFIGGFLLLILGFSIVGYVYYTESKNDSVKIAEQKNILVYSEKIDINSAGLTKENLSQKILKAQKDFNKPLNSVLYLNISNNNEPEKIENVLGIISKSLTGPFIRSLDEKYMMGIYSYDTNEPFIILTIKDYGAGYSGMLKWEESILRDLGSIFSLEGEQMNLPLADEYIKNNDLRVIKDQNQKIIFVYSFIDKNTLVITKNERILGAIINKIISNKTIK